MKASDRDLEIARGEYDDSEAVERIIAELLLLRKVASVAAGYNNRTTDFTWWVELTEALEALKADDR